MGLRLNLKQFEGIELTNLQNGQDLAWDPTANNGNGAFVNVNQPIDGAQGDKGAKGAQGGSGDQGTTGSGGNIGKWGCDLL